MCLCFILKTGWGVSSERWNSSVQDRFSVVVLSGKQGEMDTSPTSYSNVLLLDSYLPIHWTSFCKTEICQKNICILPIFLYLSSLFYFNLTVSSVPLIQFIAGAFWGLSLQCIPISSTRASNKDCPLWTQEAWLPCVSKMGIERKLASLKSTEIPGEGQE